MFIYSGLESGNGVLILIPLHDAAELFALHSFTLRHDTRCYFNVRSKANMSRLNQPHGTDNYFFPNTAFGYVVFKYCEYNRVFQYFTTLENTALQCFRLVMLLFYVFIVY